MTTENATIVTVRISQLAQTFPSLRGKPGVAPWDVMMFLRWTMVASHGEVLAAKFVLGVWNPAADWGEIAVRNKIMKRGGAFTRFDIFEAMTVWDDAHIAAMVAWLNRPFFP